MRNKKFLIYSIIVSVLLFGICAYRAATTGITYDEAFTYDHYVPSNPFLVIRYLIPFVEVIENYNFFIDPIINKISFLHLSPYLIHFPFEVLRKLVHGHGLIFANNHILNSFLISITQKLSGQYYNEFIIRLPNVLFYILYLVFAYLLCNKYKHKYLCFNLLVFNYGIHEFFGLARGYGISCSLALVGLYYFKLWYDSPDKYKFLNLSYFIMALSCYANTTSLLLFGSVILISQIHLFINKGIKENFTYALKSIFALVPIIFMTFVIVIYHFRVSNSGLYVFGGEKGFFQDVLVSVWEVYGVTFYPVIITILILLIIGVILIVNRKTLLKKPIIYISVGFFILLIGLTLGFHQLWLTSRLLIPSIPLIMVSIFEIIDVVDINKYVMSIIVIISMIPFIRNLDVTKTRDWVDSYPVKDLAYKAYKEKDNSILKPYLQDYTVIFYQEKIKAFYDYNILEGLDVEC